MKQKSTSTNFHIALNTDATGNAPEWVELIPAGPLIIGYDKRQWLHDQPDAVVSFFKESNRPLIIDYEHATEHKAPLGEPAPAAAWVEEMEVRDGGSVWGRVIWTPKGNQMVKDKEYRFLSPVLLFSKDRKRRIGGIDSVGLVGQPNLTSLKALNRAETPTQEMSMDLSKVCAALKLVDGANEDQILGAINAIKDDRDKALNASQKGPDLEKFVPRADHDALKKELNSSQARIAELESADRNKEIDGVIDQALTDGKIVPSTADYYREQCRSEGGLDKFKDFIKAAPVIGAPSGLEGKEPNKSDTLTSLEKELCSRMGLTEDEFRAANKEIA
jgi:phage I-like protein